MNFQGQFFRQTMFRWVLCDGANRREYMLHTSGIWIVSSVNFDPATEKQKSRHPNGQKAVSVLSRHKQRSQTFVRMCSKLGKWAQRLSVSDLMHIPYITSQEVSHFLYSSEGAANSKTRSFRDITFSMAWGPQKLGRIYPPYFVTPLSNGYVNLRPPPI